VTGTDAGSEVADASAATVVRLTICWAGVNSPIMGSAASPKV
jgi:hypothetical protein